MLNFLNDLNNDLRKVLLIQLRNLCSTSTDIDLLYDFFQDDRKFSKADLFALHKEMLSEVVDVYKPVGGWKKEPNSTVGIIEVHRSSLMMGWTLNKKIEQNSLKKILGVDK